MSNYPDLKNKVAIITGGTKGIGRAIADRLAEEGVNLVINYGSDEKAAAEAKTSLEKHSIKTLFVKADVSRPDNINKLFTEALEYFGHIDIVIANAGVELLSVPFVDYDEATYDRLFNLNTKGTFFVLQNAARYVTDKGRILHISSTTTIHPEKNAAIYCGSKGASKLFVDVLSKELGDRQICVNSIMPGPIDNAGVITNLEASYKQLIRDGSPFKRIGTPDEVSNVIAFLASEQAGYINGHHLTVNGGSIY